MVANQSEQTRSGILKPTISFFIDKSCLFFTFSIPIGLLLEFVLSD